MAGKARMLTGAVILVVGAAVVLGTWATEVGVAILSYKLLRVLGETPSLTKICQVRTHLQQLIQERCDTPPDRNVLALAKRIRLLMQTRRVGYILCALVLATVLILTAK